MYKYKYPSFKYKYLDLKYKYPSFKYKYLDLKYKYKYPSFKYKYEYKYLDLKYKYKYPSFKYKYLDLKYKYLVFIEVQIKYTSTDVSKNCGIGSLHQHHLIFFIQFDYWGTIIWWHIILYVASCKIHATKYSYKAYQVYYNVHMSTST